MQTLHKGRSDRVTIGKLNHILLKQDILRELEVSDQYLTVFLVRIRNINIITEIANKIRVVQQSMEGFRLRVKLQDRIEKRCHVEEQKL